MQVTRESLSTSASLEHITTVELITKDKGALRFTIWEYYTLYFQTGKEPFCDRVVAVSKKQEVKLTD